MFGRSKQQRYSRLGTTDMTLDQQVSDSAERRDSKAMETPTEVLLTPAQSAPATTTIVYKVYKRRFFGLVELILLNLIVSWGWLTYAPVALTAASFFNTSASAINWLVVGFFFAFVVVSPLAQWVLNRHGPKASIMVSAVLLIVGSWIRYGAVRVSPPSYAAVFVGQVVIGFAQPFVLAAPTKYSELWFSPKGRVTATAITTLANAFGGAIGSLVDPFLAVNPPDIGPMTLYVSIIMTVAALPAFFVPARPPTPVAPSSVAKRPPVTRQLNLLLTNPTFWLLYVPFITYVGFFNSFSTLLTQFLTPYGLSEQDAGIAGAILIVVGLVAAAITSPLIDKYKRYLLIIKLLVPILGIGYLIFIWAPPTAGIAFPYVVCALIGATSLSLVPVVLEWLCEVTYPVEPELSSVLCWTGGQLAGAIFIIISEALEAGADGDPPYNMQRALIFQGVIAMVAIPFIMLLGVFGNTKKARSEAEELSRQTTSASGTA